MRRLAAAAVGFAAAVVLLVALPAAAEPGREPPGQARKTTTTRAATTTTRPATTTTAASTTTVIGGCVGVQVPAGADIAAASAAAASGATLCLAAGTYPVHAAFGPKAGQRFIGVNGSTILDGAGTTPTSFAGYSGSPANVVLQNLTFTRFAGGGSNGLVAAVKATSGWQIIDDTFYDNRIAVTSSGTGIHIERNVIRDNWQYGLVGQPSVVADNEIARNNNRRYGTGDAGGSKFIKAAGVQLLRNWVHDNYGPGLWCDTDCSGIVYDGNTVERNVVAGIFHEVSGSATIRNNTVTDNGLLSGGLLFQADILVATSHDVDIYGNTVTSNANGIGLTDTDRGVGYALANVTVHDNTVTVEAAGHIAAGLQGRAAAYTAGNRFTANHYTVPNPAGAWWQWTSGVVTWGAWQAAGQDVAGTVG